MAAADETNETYGEAGERLVAKRAELAEAETALASARSAMDTDAVIAASQRVEVLRGFVEELERAARTELETAMRSRAEKRLTGIRRATGSLSSQMDDEEERIRHLHDELTTAVQRLNDRYQTALAFEAEAAALIDRFDLDAELPAEPAPPAARNLPVTLPALLDVAFVGSPATETHPELDWRRRRTYAEVRGSQGFEIIQLVGPKPWRALTEQEEHVLGIRRQRAERDARAGERLTPLVLPSDVAIGPI